jgi:hypothetical protein
VPYPSQSLSSWLKERERPSRHEEEGWRQSLPRASFPDLGKGGQGKRQSALRSYKGVGELGELYRGDFFLSLLGC